MEEQEDMKKEFARIFGWYKKRGMYDNYDTELRTPTWAEIFVEVGKLLAEKNQVGAVDICPPHNFVDYVYPQPWAASVPPPNKRCLKCLMETRF